MPTSDAWHSCAASQTIVAIVCTHIYTSRCYQCLFCCDVHVLVGSPRVKFLTNITYHGYMHAYYAQCIACCRFAEFELIPKSRCPVLFVSNPCHVFTLDCLLDVAVSGRMKVMYHHEQRQTGSVLQIYQPALNDTQHHSPNLPDSVR